MRQVLKRHARALRDPGVPALAEKLGTTRSAAALELWGDKLADAVVALPPVLVDPVPAKEAELPRELVRVRRDRSALGGRHVLAALLDLAGNVQQGLELLGHGR